MLDDRQNATPLIFVYGSLTSTLDHPMGHRLRREAELVGRATVAGRLYRVSWYPGLKLGEDIRDIVHGEVYRLAEPDASLVWLDEYEGITRGGLSAEAADEYLRATITARLDDGRVVTAWTYLYQPPLPETARITDGVWRG